MNASVVVVVSDPPRLEAAIEPAIEPTSAPPAAPSPAAALRVGPPAVDLQPIVEVVSRQLQGRVSEACIQALLVQLLQGRFADARMLAYLPILLARCACEQLRAVAGPPINDATASPEP